MAFMELSQRLDLAKLGLDMTGTDEQAETSDIPADGDAFAQLAALLVKVGAIEEASEASPDDTLDSLDVDSLSRIELAVRAEEHFGVSINQELFDSWATLGDAAEYLASQE